MVVVFGANAYLQGFVEIEVVAAQLLLDGMCVDLLEVVISALSHDLCVWVITVTMGMNRSSGSSTSDSRILRGGD